MDICIIYTRACVHWSEEANWSGYTLFVIKYVPLYLQPGSSSLIGWKLEVGLASYFN